MPLVLDSSAIIPLAMNDEDAGYALAVLSAMARDETFAPTLFWYEVRNVLAIGERRQRITSAVVDDFIAELERLPIIFAPPTATSDVLQIARGFQLTVYDAAYLALARSKQATMATQDVRLAKAALAAGIELFSASPDSGA
jgi:predicted nucleic acid-binding protein